MTDQAKALAEIKAKHAKRLFDSTDGDILREAIDEAVSISRASQGSQTDEMVCVPVYDPGAERPNVIGPDERAAIRASASQGSRATEDEVEKVARAIYVQTIIEEKGKPPSQHGQDIQWRNFSDRARVAIAALSPPATPQAPEDVFQGSWEGRSYCADGILLGGIEPAKGGEWRWFLSGWGGSKQQIHTEIEARASVEALVAKALLSRAHLLATPVTVTMEECAKLPVVYSGILTTFNPTKPAPGAWMAEALHRVLGDRIQIAGSEGPK